MPPKKPKITAEDEFAAAPASTRRLISNLGVEDLNLPKSMVSRIAKGVLPANTQIQKDALLAISKSATVFVNYLAAHANDRATLNNKKTIQPEDVFQTLKDLEFDEFVDRCQEEEKRYAGMLNDKRNTYRHRVKEEQARRAEYAQNLEKANIEETNSDPLVIVESRTHDAPPASKKARLSGAASVNQNEPNMVDIVDNDEGDTIDENEEEGDGDDEDLEQQAQDVTDTDDGIRDEDNLLDSEDDEVSGSD